MSVHIELPIHCVIWDMMILVYEERDAFVPLQSRQISWFKAPRYNSWWRSTCETRSEFLPLFCLSPPITLTVSRSPFTSLMAISSTNRCRIFLFLASSSFCFGVSSPAKKAIIEYIASEVPMQSMLPEDQWIFSFMHGRITDLWQDEVFNHIFHNFNGRQIVLSEPLRWQNDLRQPSIDPKHPFILDAITKEVINNKRKNKQWDMKIIVTCVLKQPLLSITHTYNSPP